MSLEHFIATWGYAAPVIGTFFEGETILVLGGFAAHHGYLHLPGVILSAFAGSLAGGREGRVFFWSAAAILFAFIGVSVGLYPYMIPMGATVSQAAASPKTQRFMLAVMGVVIPITLAYNVYQYRVFPGEGHRRGGRLRLRFRRRRQREAAWSNGERHALSRP